jgi:formate dehydrogenase subunit delta
MSHDAPSPKKLVYMANQIGKFFAPQEHGKAVSGIANHLTRFWPPSMRTKIIHHLDHGGEGLDPLVKDAVHWLKVKQVEENGYSGDA